MCTVQKDWVVFFAASGLGNENSNHGLIDLLSWEIIGGMRDLGGAIIDEKLTSGKNVETERLSKRAKFQDERDTEVSRAIVLMCDSMKRERPHNSSNQTGCSTEPSADVGLQEVLA